MLRGVVKGCYWVIYLLVVKRKSGWFMLAINVCFEVKEWVL